jgi:putative N6-adenine-specific DNA methylase
VKAANLEKQIKRHVIAQPHQYYAVTLPGLEALCVAELGQACQEIRIETTLPGGVLFSGRLPVLYTANLYLRTAGRILLRLAAFKATNFRQLEKRLSEVAWSRYLPKGCVPACRVTAHQSRLYHTQAIVQHAAQTVADHWSSLGVDPSGPQGQTLHILMQEDLATLSLDSSGPNLYQRGLKTHASIAPLRETLAAAILQLSGYDPDRPLIDPMCGAGTFSLEAALWAKQIPPGAGRDFAFMQWPAFREPRWRHLKTKALKAAKSFERAMVFASDLDGAACEQLSQCVIRNHLDDVVRVRNRDFFTLRPPQQEGQVIAPGLIVLNPPYGRRLKPDQSLVAFFERIGKKLAADFKGWRVAIIVPRPELARQMPFLLKPMPIVHGGLALTLLVGRVG